MNGADCLVVDLYCCNLTYTVRAKESGYTLQMPFFEYDEALEALTRLLAANSQC